jgi:hypothetical protein
MSKKINRLSEMKHMTLDVHRRIKGDDYYIGLKSNLQKSFDLIVKEHKDIASDDIETLKTNFDALQKTLDMCHEDLLNFASLISCLEIKYDDSEEPISKKNTKNINKEINRFDINILLRYKTKDEKKWS